MREQVRLVILVFLLLGQLCCRPEPPKLELSKTVPEHAEYLLVVEGAQNVQFITDETKVKEFVSYDLKAGESFPDRFLAQYRDQLQSLGWYELEYDLSWQDTPTGAWRRIHEDEEYKGGRSASYWWINRDGGAILLTLRQWEKREQSPYDVLVQCTYMAPEITKTLISGYAGRYGLPWQHDARENHRQPVTDEQD